MRNAQHNEDFARQVLASIREGVIVLDRDFRCTFWNRSMEEVSGLPAADVLGQHVDEFFPWARQRNLIAFINRALAGETCSSPEILVHAPLTGAEIWTTGRFEPLRDAARQITGVIITVQDITAQKQASERLNQALRVAKLGIFEHDHLTGEIYWSPTVREMLGYTPDERVDFPKFLTRIHPDDQIGSVDAIRKAHDPAGDGLFSWESRFLHPDGTTRWLSTRSRTFFAPVDGVLRPVRTIGATADITDRKHAEDILRAAKTAAEEANAAKDHFLAVLSHELRTPLTPALAAVDLLRADSELPDRFRSDLDIIRRNVELEARLIDDLLDVTRILRGKTELNRRPVPLRSAIAQAVEVCRRDMETRAQHLHLDLHDAADAIIDGDDARLQQIFWNLLKNAVKFAPHAGQIDIIGRRGPADCITVEVRDNGIGIEPELLPRLFRPFEQGGAGTTRQFGGLGLGLTITKGLVEMHGGAISAHSAGRGQGATFTVRLPLSDRPAEGPKLPAPAPEPLAAPPLRILYVEDHGDTARVMRRILAAKGYHVELAGDVATALSRAATHTFDLLLSDLGLPDGSGLDIIRELRRQGHTLPAIALSGFGQEEDIQRSLAAGFALHLTKPVNPARLLSAIAEHTHRMPVTA